MDPNAALETIRKFCENFDTDAKGVGWDDIQVMVETFQGLDEWISSGGFRPNDWSV